MKSVAITATTIKTPIKINQQQQQQQNSPLTFTTPQHTLTLPPSTPSIITPSTTNAVTSTTTTTTTPSSSTSTTTSNQISSAGLITKDKLKEYYSMPIQLAAGELGICTTMLKQICRRLGIQRWPHRKIQSLNSTIYQLETTLARNDLSDELRQVRREELAVATAKKAFVLERPDAEVDLSCNKIEKMAKELKDFILFYKVEPAYNFIVSPPAPPPSSSLSSHSSINSNIINSINNNGNDGNGNNNLLTSVIPSFSIPSSPAPPSTPFSSSSVTMMQSVVNRQSGHHSHSRSNGNHHHQRKQHVNLPIIPTNSVTNNINTVVNNNSVMLLSSPQRVVAPPLINPPIPLNNNNNTNSQQNNKIYSIPSILNTENETNKNLIKFKTCEKINVPLCPIPIVPTNSNNTHLKRGINCDDPSFSPIKSKILKFDSSVTPPPILCNLNNKESENDYRENSTDSSTSRHHHNHSRHHRHRHQHQHRHHHHHSSSSNGRNFSYENDDDEMSANIIKNENEYDDEEEEEELSGDVSVKTKFNSMEEYADELEKARKEISKLKKECSLLRKRLTEIEGYNNHDVMSIAEENEIKKSFMTSSSSSSSSFTESMKNNEKIAEDTLSDWLRINKGSSCNSSSTQSPRSATFSVSPPPHSVPEQFVFTSPLPSASSTASLSGASSPSSTSS